MDRNGISPATHYHIRWSQLTLDWERFDTREEAEERAIQLVLEGEYYTIDAFDGTCAHCGTYNPPRRRAAASGR
jgi:hypothetical protein